MSTFVFVVSVIVTLRCADCVSPTLTWLKSLGFVDAHALITTRNQHWIEFIMWMRPGGASIQLHLIENALTEDIACVVVVHAEKDKRAVLIC